jgi:DNA-binding LacI/PurR family transcriptional regulator
MNNLSDIQKAENYLRKAALGIKIGEKLPSVRMIRQKCEVSQSAIDRAIENLRNDNLVEVRARSGLYRSIGQPPDVKIYYFSDLTGLKSHQNMLFHGFFVNRLFFTLCNSGRRLNLIEKCTKSVSEEEYQSLLIQRPCTILTIGIKEAELERFKHLEQVGYTVIHLLPDLPTPPEASLQIDDAKLMEGILTYLTEKGITRVAYFHRMQPDVWRRAENLRWAAFHHHALQMGLDIKKEYVVAISPTWEPFLESVAQEAEKLMKLPTPPQALILTGDHFAKSVYHGLRRAGAEPGKDIAVIGIDNLPCCEFYDPSLSSASFEVDSSFDMLKKLICDMENGGEKRVLMLPVKIFERESTSLFSK